MAHKFVHLKHKDLMLIGDSFAAGETLAVQVQFRAQFSAGVRKQN